MKLSLYFNFSIRGKSWKYLQYFDFKSWLESSATTSRKISRKNAFLTLQSSKIMLCNMLCSNQIHTSCLILGGILLLRWPKFAYNWLLTYPCWHLWRSYFTVTRKNLYTVDISSAYHLPLSSCQRSLWIFPLNRISKVWVVFLQKLLTRQY